MEIQTGTRGAWSGFKTEPEPSLGPPGFLGGQDPANGFTESIPASCRHNAAQKAIRTASYGANRLGLEAGKFVFLDFGGANEEYVKLLSVDPDNQTVEAIVTLNHAAGERIRPTMWPTPILNEGDDLAFDVLAVASPDPGSDLTVIIQT